MAAGSFEAPRKPIAREHGRSLWHGKQLEKARRKELTAAQARKVLAELVAASSGEELTFHSVEDWLTGWLSNKAGSHRREPWTDTARSCEIFLSILVPRQGLRSQRYRQQISRVSATISIGKDGRRPPATRSSKGFSTAPSNWPASLAISRPIRFQPWSLFASAMKIVRNASRSRRLKFQGFWRMRKATGMARSCSADVGIEARDV